MAGNIRRGVNIFGVVELPACWSRLLTYVYNRGTVNSNFGSLVLNGWNNSNGRIAIQSYATEYCYFSQAIDATNFNWLSIVQWSLGYAKR